MASRSHRVGDTSEGLRAVLGMAERAPRRKGVADPEWQLFKQGDKGNMRENLVEGQNNASIKQAALGEPRMGVQERLKQQREVENRILREGGGGGGGRGKQALDDVARHRRVVEEERERAREQAVREKKLQQEAIELQRQIKDGDGAVAGLLRKQRDDAARDQAFRERLKKEEAGPLAHLEKKAQVQAEQAALIRQKEDGMQVGHLRRLQKKGQMAAAREADLKMRREAEERGREAAIEARRQAALARKEAEAQDWRREAAGPGSVSRLEYIRREQAYAKALRGFPQYR